MGKSGRYQDPTKEGGEQSSTAQVVPTKRHRTVLTGPHRTVPSRRSAATSKPDMPVPHSPHRTRPGQPRPHRSARIRSGPHRAVTIRPGLYGTRKSRPGLCGRVQRRL